MTDKEFKALSKEARLELVLQLIGGASIQVKDAELVIHLKGWLHQLVRVDDGAKGNA